MRFLATLVLLSLAVPGCAREERPGEPTPGSFDTMDADANSFSEHGSVSRAATAVIEPAGRSSVEGTARLTDVGNGVRVVVLVRGLEPAGDHYHGLQILAATDCEDVDDESAHFDPDGAPHGPFDAGRGARHAGDLGNIRAYDGAGRYDRVDPLLELEGPRSVIGRALVIRAEADDAWSSDGSAGEVDGCGVLEPVDHANVGGP